jgi:hypothetical protein
MTLDYDHADQPLTAGDTVGIVFNRDVTTDTYSGDACIAKWEFKYTSVGIPNHN